MKMLFNAKDLLGGMPEGTKNDGTELKETILEYFKDGDTKISLGEFTFGVTSPDSIKSIAKGWNEKILAKLMKAIGDIMSNPAAFALDSDASFQLFKAARLADGRFSIWGDAGIMYIGDSLCPNYTTIIPERLLEEILEAPEEWAIVDLIVC